jgi:hypothetical protein
MTRIQQNYTHCLTILHPQPCAVMEYLSKEPRVVKIAGIGDISIHWKWDDMETTDLRANVKMFTDIVVKQHTLSVLAQMKNELELNDPVKFMITKPLSSEVAII